MKIYQAVGWQRSRKVRAVTQVLIDVEGRVCAIWHLLQAAKLSKVTSTQRIDQFTSRGSHDANKNHAARPNSAFPVKTPKVTKVLALEEWEINCTEYLLL